MASDFELDDWKVLLMFELAQPGTALWKSSTLMIQVCFESSRLSWEKILRNAMAAMGHVMF